MRVSALAFCPEIGAALAREALGLGAAPGLDALVVAGEQHVGNRAALPVARARVVRIFQKAGVEAFLGQRCGVTHDAGQVVIYFDGELIDQCTAVLPVGSPAR